MKRKYSIEKFLPANLWLDSPRWHLTTSRYISCFLSSDFHNELVLRDIFEYLNVKMRLSVIKRQTAVQPITRFGNKCFRDIGINCVGSIGVILVAYLVR